MQDSHTLDDAFEDDGMLPLYDEYTEQVLPLGSFGGDRHSVHVHPDFASAQPKPPRRGHVMEVVAVQALGTDQAYSPSFDTYARCPPASGGYLNASVPGSCGLTGSGISRML